MHFELALMLALGATFEPTNLKGITNMRVIVEDIPGADRVGLDADSVQTDIESILQKAGLETTRIPGILPYLHLQLTVLPLPNDCVAYSVRLSLKTGADIVGTKKLVMADLWSDGMLGARCKTDKKAKTDTEVAKVIRQSINDETIKMISDILAANHK
jgi:hypothetical protein